LTVDGGLVTGEGWLSGKDNPVTPLSVNGAFSSGSYTLTLSHWLTGSPIATFSGAATGPDIGGNVVLGVGATPKPVVLKFMTAGASGRYSATATGAASEQPSAAAGFGMDPGGFVLVLAYPGRGYHLAALGRPGPRLAVGNYQIAPGSGFGGEVVPAYAPGQQSYRITTGSLRIDVSTPFALIGEFTVSAQEEGSGATVTLTAKFEAGCALAICQ
jgi:hypothetical protein